MYFRNLNDSSLKYVNKSLYIVLYCKVFLFLLLWSNGNFMLSRSLCVSSFSVDNLKNNSHLISSKIIPYLTLELPKWSKWPLIKLTLPMFQIQAFARSCSLQAVAYCIWYYGKLWQIVSFKQRQRRVNGSDVLIASIVVPS